MYWTSDLYWSDLCVQPCLGFHFTKVRSFWNLFTSMFFIQLFCLNKHFFIKNNEKIKVLRWKLAPTTQIKVLLELTHSSRLITYLLLFLKFCTVRKNWNNKLKKVLWYLILSPISHIYEGGRLWLRGRTSHLVIGMININVMKCFWGD